MTKILAFILAHFCLGEGRILTSISEMCAFITWAKQLTNLVLTMYKSPNKDNEIVEGWFSLERSQ